MLYIHTLKNDQKTGKFFERWMTEMDHFHEKSLAEVGSKNQDLEARALAMIKAGSFDKKEWLALINRMKEEKAALSAATKTQLTELAQKLGWRGMARDLNNLQTFAQVADSAVNRKVEQTISASVPKVEALTAEQLAVNNQVKWSPRIVNTQQNMWANRQAMERQVEISEAQRQEALSQLVKNILEKNPNIKTVFTDGSRNWTGSNILADGKNIDLKWFNAFMRQNKISPSELVTALNKELWNKRIAEFQANLPKVEAPEVDLSSITVKSTFARRGDTLEKIAKEQWIDVGALLKANPSIRNPNQITAGTKINFPDFTGTTMVAGRRVDNRATASLQKTVPNSKVPESKIAEEARRSSEKQAAEDAQRRQLEEMEAMMRSWISA
jgi:LysM repeat protein/lambda repressor-like predicted transcriptional regulator